MKKFLPALLAALVVGGAVYAEHTDKVNGSFAQWFQKGFFVGPDAALGSRVSDTTSNKVTDSHSTTLYLDFGNTDAGCAQQSGTLTGALVGDTCSLASDSLPSGGNFTCNITAADTATVSYCNPSNVTINPADAGFTIRTFRSGS